jgi:hypothetical protein
MRSLTRDQFLKIFGITSRAFDAGAKMISLGPLTSA